MEAVFVAFQSLIIFPHSLPQVQPDTDQSRVVSVAQRVVGRPGGLDAQSLHGGFQSLLGIGAVGLGVENHLDVVPPLGKSRVQAEKLEIFPENTDVVKAPGQKYDVLAAPGKKPLHGLRKGHALVPEPVFLDACELADPAVQVPVEFGAHHDLEFISHLLRLRHPDGANLDNFSPNLYREHLLRGGGTGPGLVPLHIQNDIIHVKTSVTRIFSIIPHRAASVNRKNARRRRSGRLVVIRHDRFCV